MKLNIGGGPYWGHDGWLSLDATTGFDLTSDCTLPLDASPLVYTSHTLEHLDDDTVSRVLNETRRVLRGTLVVKLPDFDELLRRYAADDHHYFANQWGLEPAVVPTLHNRGMEDTIATRAAYMLGGWWNRAFGNLFGGYNVSAPGAYSGPAVMSQEQLRQVLALPSPHLMAKTFRDHTIGTEADYTFNHQNAWSADEFRALLRAHDFELLDDNKDRIVQKYEPRVPGMAAMFDISMCFEAR